MYAHKFVFINKKYKKIFKGVLILYLLLNYFFVFEIQIFFSSYFIHFFVVVYESVYIYYFRRH